jgi:hypothetical protein
MFKLIPSSSPCEALRGLDRAGIPRRCGAPGYVRILDSQVLCKKCFEEARENGEAAQ